uniref:Putative bacteriophage protein n=1 Tax=uncultured bacterium contig00055 TaxID=1181539 RepID=A0A806KFV7_9BACT|nr:putative bacteriophage protein [uncultured bacterium contig00055]
MAGVTFNYQIPPKSIGGFQIDGFISERYKFGNSVTDIPMEDGSTASDHVIENALEIHISGFIGNAEFTVFEGGASSSAEDPKARIRAAYLELLRLKSERQPLDLVTGLDTYPDMVITSFEIDRNAETGADLPFEMTFKQIRVIKSETTSINAHTRAADADQVAGDSNMGVAGTTKVDQQSNQMREEWRIAVRNGMATPQEYQQKWGVPYPQ